jgi:hypothetical protein
MKHDSNMAKPKNSKLPFLIITTFLLIVFCNLVNSHIAQAVAVYPADGEPFGTSYDEWVAKFWNWWLSQSMQEIVPKPGGCVANISGSLVMMMENAYATNAHQTCEITSSQGIMMPLWISWCDNVSDKSRIRPDANLSQELSECARENYSVGNIKSEVKIDNVPFAKLDVSNQFRSGKLDYKINSLNNVTTLNTTSFTLTVPCDSHNPSAPRCKTVEAGSYGWWIFLKPLPPGEHLISYYVDVSQEGKLGDLVGNTANAKDMSYLFRVK